MPQGFSWYWSTFPAAGGGGMAQPSLLDQLFSYLVWGVFALIIAGVAVALLRRIYRTAAARDGAEADDAES